MIGTLVLRNPGIFLEGGAVNKMGTEQLQEPYPAVSSWSSCSDEKSPWPLALFCHLQGKSLASYALLSPRQLL